MDAPVLKDLLLDGPRGLVSVTGAGGKTTLLFAMARLLSAAGRRVLTTTTTRIFHPEAAQSSLVLLEPDPARVLEQAPRLLGVSGHVTAAAGLLPDGRKLMGYSAEQVSLLMAGGAFDWILVEADGARGLPLKAPAAHEPVVPPETTVHLAVAGLDAVGARLSEERVFRSELAGACMGLRAGDVVSEIALAKLAAHPDGAFKGSPLSARRVLFLNKADDEARRRAGARTAEALARLRSPLERVIVGEAQAGLCIHSVHDLEARA